MTHFDQNITFSAGHGAPQNETKSPNKILIGTRDQHL